MEIYDYAFDKDKWEQFYDSFSTNEHAYKADVKKLRSYIDEKKYIEVCEIANICKALSTLCKFMYICSLFPSLG
jgi:hypothetical protein